MLKDSEGVVCALRDVSGFTGKPADLTSEAFVCCLWFAFPFGFCQRKCSPLDSHHAKLLWASLAWAACKSAAFSIQI